MYIVFLPAYNEEAALPSLVYKFHNLFKRLELDYRIVVWDDGSTDFTRASAKSLAMLHNVDVQWHEKNQGLGLTMLHGLKYVASIAKDDDVIVTMDADDTHEPYYFLDAIKVLRDVVILSRYKTGGAEEGLSISRSILSRGAGLFLKLMFPIKGVQEYSCGYRVFTGKILKRSFAVFGDKFVQLHKWGFVVTPEILIKWRMIGSLRLWGISAVTVVSGSVIGQVRLSPKQSET